MIHELSLDYKEEHPLSWGGMGVPQGLLKMVCVPFVKGCQKAQETRRRKGKNPDRIRRGVRYNIV